MSRKVEVIECDGSRLRVKKSVAQLMLRRLIAVEIAPFLIRRIPLRAHPAQLPQAPLPDAQEYSTSSSVCDKALGIRVVRPPVAENPTLPRVNIEPLLLAAPGWDWNFERFPF